MWISVGVLLYSILQKTEQFEITPWKKTCLDDNPSPCCCPAGFNGRHIQFEYTDDADRLKCGNNSRPITAKEMMSQPDSTVQENYTSGCGCG